MYCIYKHALSSLQNPNQTEHNEERVQKMLAHVFSLYFRKFMRLDFVFRHLLPRILSNQIGHMCSLAMWIILKDRNSHVSIAEHWIEATYPEDTSSS